MPNVGESSLHAALINWYSQSGDLLEYPVAGYVIDIVRGTTLIEIQTGNFIKIKPKLENLLASYKVCLVHPIAHQKWIVSQQSVNDSKFTRRKSPKKGRIDHLFNELVYIPKFLTNSNFSLEVLLTNEEEIRLNDGKGSWRRHGWSIKDRNLLKVIDREYFENPIQLVEQFRDDLVGQFTAKEIASRRKISDNLGRKIIYCLVKMNVITRIGKRGRANLYALL